MNKNEVIPMKMLAHINALYILVIIIIIRYMACTTIFSVLYVVRDFKSNKLKQRISQKRTLHIPKLLYSSLKIQCISNNLLN